MPKFILQIVWYVRLKFNRSFKKRGGTVFGSRHWLLGHPWELLQSQQEMGLGDGTALPKGLVSVCSASRAAGQSPDRASLQETLPSVRVGASPALPSLPSSSFYVQPICPKAGLTKPRLSSRDTVICWPAGSLGWNQPYLVLSGSLQTHLAFPQKIT